MNWLRWIRPGLIATLLVAIIAIVARSGTIQQDLAARVVAQLAADGQGWANVEVSARDVTVLGTAPSTDAQELAVRSARRVAGVRSVTDGSGLLPIASPYVWSARREDRSIVLSGSVPSDGARAALLAAARRALPEGEIRDAMGLARGAPASFNSATTFALSSLADLGEGMVTLTDTTLAVSGTAATADAYAAAQAALRGELPVAVNLGPIDVQPARADPFVWSANYDGKSVTLVGYVPNAIVHETLVATAKATLPGAPILDTVSMASGAPSGFAEAASFAISALEHLSQGGVTLDGLRLDVTGSAKTVDDYEALLAGLSGPLPDGMKVVASAITPASVSPYGWQGERANGTVVLSGYVPSATSRDDVAATARIMFAGAKIDDRVRVAAGEPRMDWIGAIKFAMGELAKLDHGKVSLHDQSYAIEGAAVSPDAYMSIRDVNARTLPASLALVAGEVTPPVVEHYHFAAVRQGAGILISGNVPDDADREAIFTAAHRKFGSAEIAGDLVFASGAPPDFVDASSAALQILSRLAGGRVEITDRALSIEGIASQPNAVEEIADSLPTVLPAGFTVATNTIAAGQSGQPVAAVGCRDLLQAVLQTGHIAFDGSKADITADSIGLLDRVAAVISRCTGVVIEVGAYSDSEGSSSRNKDRTQARAEAIVDLLVGAGVKREALTAIGYGEANPVADNGTEAGRAANQRIEFTVATPEGG